MLHKDNVFFTFVHQLYNLKNKRLNLDIVFPYISDCYSGKKNIAWIADFQENYYPLFFSMEELCARMVTRTKIAYSNESLVVSSNDVKRDFVRLFPKHSCTLTVLPFVSSLINQSLYKN